MMNEKLKRHWAACEALSMGRGGIAAVALATGLSRTTIRKGIREVQQLYTNLADQAVPYDRTRTYHSCGTR
jgi:hypothetical protein